jgi:hypothetical protein
MVVFWCSKCHTSMENERWKAMDRASRGAPKEMKVTKHSDREKRENTEGRGAT